MYRSDADMEKQPSKQTTILAMNQLRTWLQAVGIQVTNRSAIGMSVLDAAGTERNVQVVIGNTDLPEGALLINAKDLTSRNLRDSFEAFKVLQRELGFEPKLPVNRGKLPEHKLANGEDFDLAAIRHTRFRRSPDPAPEKFVIYRDVMVRACRRFYRLNQRRCDDHVLVEDDLMTYALAWMTQFCALYEMSDKPQTENEKLLYTYLMQRFDEFQQLLTGKEKNELAKLDDAYIGTRGMPYDYSNKASWEGEDPRMFQDEEEKTEAEFIDTSTVEGRAEIRARAAVFANELDERLGALGHDKMVAVLRQAADNDRIHPDAQVEAGKRLEAHLAVCDACRAAAVSAAPSGS
jgi:hypothetical protein